MNIDTETQNHVANIFRPLNNRRALRTLPSPASLSKLLLGRLPENIPDVRDITANDASLFSTATIDMWHRGLHSLLVSASLTNASPIWACVSGYYASHYAIRSIAHSLGHFLLFRRKRLVKLTANENQCSCRFISRNAGDAEHKIYWKLVKQHPVFASDGLFTNNDADAQESDIRHRNHANYADHIFNYPVFSPLNVEFIRIRIDQISKIVLDGAPIPRYRNFPDIEYVQLVAYHRLMTVRIFLDEALGTSNRFWMNNRSPQFASGVMTFQLASGAGSLSQEL